MAVAARGGLRIPSPVAARRRRLSRHRTTCRRGPRACRARTHRARTRPARCSRRRSASSRPSTTCTSPGSRRDRRSRPAAGSRRCCDRFDRGYITSSGRPLPAGHAAVALRDVRRAVGPGAAGPRRGPPGPFSKPPARPRRPRRRPPPARRPPTASFGSVTLSDAAARSDKVRGALRVARRRPGRPSAPTSRSRSPGSPTSSRARWRSCSRPGTATWRFACRSRKAASSSPRGASRRRDGDQPE